MMFPGKLEEKNTMKVIIIFSTAIAALFVSTAVPAAAEDWSKIQIQVDVEFSVNPGKAKLMPHSGSKGCSRGKGKKSKGCVKFPLNTKGEITFKLMGSAATKTCADPGAQYVITKVELSHQGYLLDEGSGPFISDKGIFGSEDPGWAVPTWLQDAFPGTNDKGVVYSASKDEASGQVTIANENNGGDDDPKDVWYRVSVTDCDDDAAVPVLSTDPRLENDGTTE
jgi:hypothetical protein